MYTIEFTPEEKLKLAQSLTAAPACGMLDVLRQIEGRIERVRMPHYMCVADIAQSYHGHHGVGVLLGDSSRRQWVLCPILLIRLIAQFVTWINSSSFSCMSRS